MNTKRSHKIFSLVMLILIVATVVAATAVAMYNVYDYKQQQKAYDELLSAASEVSSEA